MKGLFVDTAGWVALVDGSDPAHHAARRQRDELLREGYILVSTDYVADETLTLMRMRFGLDVAAQWWDQVESSAWLRWEWIDASRAEQARRWFFRYHDKTFSFTDCTSFAVMRELRLRRALTLDRHFTQAGFEALPR